MSSIKKLLVAAVAAVTLLVLGAGATYAVLTGRVTGANDQNLFVHETNTWVTAAAAWTDVPGATRAVTVPAGSQRYLSARFSGESFCSGGGWCSVRIVVVAPSGAVVEMDPIVGTDYAFDSGSGSTDAWEGHAMERSSPKLNAGAYQVKVQAAVVAGATGFNLDDWTFVVERLK
jgi:hypothetical protein